MPSVPGSTDRSGAVVASSQLKLRDFHTKIAVCKLIIAASRIQVTGQQLVRRAFSRTLDPAELISSHAGSSSRSSQSLALSRERLTSALANWRRA